ncbi:MAG: DUF6088 family protein [Victivallales bacterium]
MQSIENKIYSRICGNGKGWTFSNKDFSDLGTAGAIDIALHRLIKSGKILRACRGIYYYPKYSELLKITLGPDIDEVAHAIARRSGWRILADGNTALNLLGLSTQVPTRWFYLSDGAQRHIRYKIGNSTLEFMNAPLKEASVKNHTGSLVVQALKTLGQERMTDALIRKLSTRIPPAEKKRILKDIRYVSGWIRETILKACKEN